jgi:hypothetical protein
MALSSQHITVEYSNVQYSTAHYSTVQYSTVQYSTVQHSRVQYNTVQYSTVQHSTVQHSTVKYSTAQHSTVQHSTVKYRNLSPNSDLSAHPSPHHNFLLLAPYDSSETLLPLQCYKLSNNQKKVSPTIQTPHFKQLLPQIQGGGKTIYSFCCNVTTSPHLQSYALKKDKNYCAR